MANELTIVKNSKFDPVSCDFYGNGKGEFFMTRQQIGEALEYDFPKKAIEKIHARHKDRLDQFSIRVSLDLRGNQTDSPLGSGYGEQETVLYSAKGVYETCRWSRQPKADAFYDYVYEILEELRLNQAGITKKDIKHWEQMRAKGILTRHDETDAIKDFVQYAISQGSTHADMYYVLYSKLANNMVGLLSGQRDLATIDQLCGLTVVENIIAKTILAGIELGMPYKDIYQACKARLETLKDALTADPTKIPIPAPKPKKSRKKKN